MTREEFIEKWGASMGHGFTDEELSADLDSLPLHPAGGAEDGMMFTISEDGINPLDDEPTAEGAEEILDKYPHSTEYPSFIHENSAIAAMTEFATLHAQRIADKIVSERQREYRDTLMEIKSLFTEANGEIVISERDVFKAYEIINNAICSIK